ncbi:MAG: tetratricopeptide repeat protein [Cyclobacteriaceae bacterium]|nr:tetratricopeptide repeat protein [Cyclobacteriaceae bacterium]
MRYILILLSLACTEHLIAQQDSLYQKLYSSSGVQRVDVLTDIARSFQVGAADSVFKYGALAYREAQQLNYNNGQVKALLNLGLAKRMISQYDSSLVYFNKALSQCDSVDTPDLVAELHMGIGGAYYYKGMPDVALTYFTRAAEGFEKLNLEERLTSAYSNLGIVMNAVGQGEKALEYYRKALAYATKHDLLNVKLPTLINIAVYYDNLENNDSAFYYANRCYEVSKQKNLKYAMARALLILPGVYSRMELYPQALSSAREGKALFKEMGDSAKLRSMTYEEAAAYAGLKQHDRALRMCKQLIETLDDGQSLKEKVLLLASKVSTALGDHQQALTYHEAFFEVYKNASIEKQKQQLTELELKYDTDRKSREIQQLADQARIQELTIQRQSIAIISGVAVFVAIILASFLYWRQKSLRKNLRVIQLENSLLRNQMNPHFIFNALSAIQKFVVKGDAMQGASFISRFAQLMRRYLQQSRQENISLSEEIETLTNYLDVQRLRFSNLKYEISVDESINPDTIYIPPLMAQPFIENALEHGVSGKVDGKVEISFDQQGHDLKVTIRDNGEGLRTDKGADHASMATRITMERLEQMGTSADDLKVRNVIEDGNIHGVEVSLVLRNRIAG